MPTNKVDAFGKNLIDLTSDTVTENDLPSGVTAHNAAGERITGTTNYVPIVKASATVSPNAWIRVFQAKRPQCVSAEFRIHCPYQQDNKDDILVFQVTTANTGATAHTAVINQMAQLFGQSNYYDEIRVVTVPEEDLIAVEVHNKLSVDKIMNVDLSNIFMDSYWSYTLPMTVSVGNPTVIADLVVTPSTGIIAGRAVADSLGNKIDETYAKVSSVYQHSLPNLGTLGSENLDTVFLNEFSRILNGQISEGYFLAANSLSIGSGWWYFKMFKIANSYGWIEFTRYGAIKTSSVVKAYKNFANGELGDFMFYNISSLSNV